MATAKLEGADDLKKAFAHLSTETKREVKEIIRETADDIKRDGQARIPIGPGKLGQHTRDTVKRTTVDSGLGATVGSAWFVARFLEHGTKNMAARPWLFPAFESNRQKFVERVKAAVYGVTRSVS